MGRPPRLIADGLIYHALNRGNNRARVFAHPADVQQFLKALGQTQERYPFRLYAYCLMSNHFHLVVEPDAGQNISRILQSLTVAHTWHYHKALGTSGHVWQGRFKSPAVATDEHLLTVMRYVESNPLRAGLVTDLADYPWSSYPAYGLGQAVPLVAEAPVWGALRKEKGKRKGVGSRFQTRKMTVIVLRITTPDPFSFPLFFSFPFLFFSLFFSFPFSFPMPPSSHCL